MYTVATDKINKQEKYFTKESTVDFEDSLTSDRAPCYNMPTVLSESLSLLDTVIVVISFKLRKLQPYKLGKRFL